VADWGGAVVEFTRTAASTSWANTVRESGDATQTVGENRHTSTPEVRFETQIGNPDVVLQTTLAARADADAADRLNHRASLNLTLRPGVVNSPQDLALGAQITVVLQVGRLNVAAVYTVQQLTANLDDTGVTSAEVGLLGP
jgi:hypothetical protein